MQTMNALGLLMAFSTASLGMTIPQIRSSLQQAGDSTLSIHNETLNSLLGGPRGSAHEQLYDNIAQTLSKQGVPVSDRQIYKVNAQFTIQEDHTISLGDGDITLQPIVLKPDLEQCSGNYYNRFADPWKCAAVEDPPKTELAYRWDEYRWYESPKRKIMILDNAVLEWQRYCQVKRIKFSGPFKVQLSLYSRQGHKKQPGYQFRINKKGKTIFQPLDGGPIIA